MIASSSPAELLLNARDLVQTLHTSRDTVQDKSRRHSSIFFAAAPSGSLLLAALAAVAALAVSLQAKRQWLLVTILLQPWAESLVPLDSFLALCSRRRGSTWE